MRRKRLDAPVRWYTAAHPSKTTVVVRGRPNPQQAAGKDGGLKLMEIKRLKEKGHAIILLTESRFWRLVSRR